MAMEVNPANDTANIKSYGLAMVQWEGYGRIICEGFKFDRKLKAEAKKDCAQLNGYDWDLSDFEYEWEITEPHDHDFIDERYEKQVYDKHGLTIIGYAQDENGNWVEKERLTSCIITDTGREYGGGIKRTLKGSALSCVSNYSTTGTNSSASRGLKNN